MPPLLDPLDDDGPDLAWFGKMAAWGGIAAFSLLLAVLAIRSDTGAARISALVGGPPGTAATARPADNETRRLAERIEALSADRDRLLARLETIEQGIRVIGSNSAPGPTRPHAPIEGSQNAPSSWPAPGPRGAYAAAPSSSEAASGFAEQTLVIAANRLDRADETAAFAIDLGTGASLDALRGVWRVVKAQHGGAVEGMQPLIAVRDGTADSALELRLIAGPIANLATAAKTCAVVGATGRFCQPARFEGQRLASR